MTAAPAPKRAARSSSGTSPILPIRDDPLAGGARICDRVLSLLSAKAGTIISARELVECMYRNHSDGGPDCAPSYLRHVIANLRRAGHRIETHHGRGYRLVIA